MEMVLVPLQFLPGEQQAGGPGSDPKKPLYYSPGLDVPKYQQEEMEGVMILTGLASKLP